jgi:hypothetical protein
VTFPKRQRLAAGRAQVSCWHVSDDQTHRRRIDRVLDPAYLDDLEGCALDEVRRRHEECLEIETEVSYVRRLAQARLDILDAELQRRQRGGTVGDLIDALPRILSDEGPRASAAKSRLPRHLAPSPDIPWRRGLEHLVSDATLANLPNIPDEELHATMDQLRELEQDVSSKRRALHRVIDRIEADLAARHKAVGT